MMTANEYCTLLYVIMKVYEYHYVATYINDYNYRTK